LKLQTTQKLGEATPKIVREFLLRGHENPIALGGASDRTFARDRNLE
jgi:hypothetical protein